MDLLEVIDDPALRASARATELVAAALDRIAASNPVINAYITVRGEEAMAEAEAIDADVDVGLLAGIPVAVKDNVDVAGMRCTAGSAFFADRVADTDAEVVRRLRAAGAVVVGKVGLHEFAYGATSNNPHYGAIRNPHDPTRIPGGSSGGSGAALAADTCVLAVGTDTGGSIRLPAGLNGVSGLRPTYGSVSVRGSTPVSASLDTIGPMARSIRDVALMYRVMAGFDPADPWSVDGPLRDPLATLDDGVEGLRIGVPTTVFFDDLQPDVDRAVRAAAAQFATLGADVVDVDLPGGQEAGERANQLIRAEALSVHQKRMDTEPERFGEDVRRRLALGRDVDGVGVAIAIRTMREWRALILDRFSTLDLILTPTTPDTAPPIEGSEMIQTTARLTRFSYPISLAGVPAASIPCGFDRDRLPIGLQLVAAPWRDDVVLRAGAAYQAATDWHRRRPGG